MQGAEMIRKFDASYMCRATTDDGFQRCTKGRRGVVLADEVIITHDPFHKIAIGAPITPSISRRFPNLP